ncbi:MAG: NADH-quinone oxidoreductase subunit L [Candidatus Schekmanbacteria bacterium]|nr:NADH-quinone oxidoreductase subunit L [Candidatus Schekmanbacteria bacterium]
MLALIPLLPLIGFLINGAWYAFGQAPAGRKQANAAITGTLASLAIGASFVVSLILFLQLRGMSPEAGDHRFIEQTLFNWMQIGAFQLPMTLRVDALSALFTLFITGVGTLIHIYAIGYMSHDETPGKFFAFLNLFCFAMLMLVLGASLPILFLGWEGVGLCSYLLIGYWYTDDEKASAGKKAFIVNRIGDFGFLLGMFLIYATFGTLELAQLTAAVHGGLPAGVAESTVTAICLLLFLGCVGKSAQFPLYVWLPDAMAGPTPVSALIHAATMVTSGIYLVARLNVLFSLSPQAMLVVATVGAFTALLAATIAIAQRDIKKVLAYSTVSQLGYMFLGCGVGAFSAGVFHVVTHAFFKALLFLGAGSVIHGMHEEQDIMKMGGLRKQMPRTFAVFAVAWLAICGIPPFSGFFSKDEILWQAYSSTHGHALLWGFGALTAVMTAFYMTRLFSLTFLGTPRFQEHGAHGHGDGHGHGTGAGAGVHESPAVMILPLAVLALLSAVGGFIGVPHASWLDEWLDPVIHSQHELAAGVSGSTEWLLMGVSVAGAAIGIFFALRLYADLARAEALRKRFAGLHQALVNKWYVDELYDHLFVRPIHALSQGLWKGFDVAVIDRIVLGIGYVTQWTGQTVRVVQTGSTQVYAFMFVVGLIATVGYLIYGLA